jgi:hypothetical protein
MTALTISFRSGQICMEDASKFGLIVHGRPVPVVNILSGRGSSLASVENKSKQGGTAGSFLGSCPQLYSDQYKGGNQRADRLARVSYRTGCACGHNQVCRQQVFYLRNFLPIVGDIRFPSAT